MRTFIKSVHFENFGKKRKVDNDLLISRHFKRIPFRRSHGNIDTAIDYIVSFRINRRKRNYTSETSDDEWQPASMKGFELGTTLHISLFNRSNFMTNCSDTIEIERYLSNKQKWYLKSIITFGGLEVMSRKLLDCMYIVDNHVYYSYNLPVLVNSVLDIENNCDDDTTATGFIRDDLKGSNIRRVNRYEKDGCVYDEGIDPIEKPVGPVFTEEERMKALVKIQRAVKQWFRRQLEYWSDQDGPEARRKILFNGLAKKDDHYVNMIVLINKKKDFRGEVHAFDFNDLNKLQPLVLDEKVLYSTDLEISEIFRKVDLNFKDSKVEITEYNKYKINMDRIMDKVYNISSEDLERLTRLQAFFKMKLKKNFYSMQRLKIQKGVMDNKEHKLLSRFFKVYKGNVYVIVVYKHKFDKKLMVFARLHKPIKPVDNKLLVAGPYEMFSNKMFKEVQEGNETRDVRSHELDEYLQQLKERIKIESTTDGLVLSMTESLIDKKYDIKSAKEYEEVNSKNNLEDHVKNYELRYQEHLKKIFFPKAKRPTESSSKTIGPILAPSGLASRQERDEDDDLLEPSSNTKVAVLDAMEEKASLQQEIEILREEEHDPRLFEDEKNIVGIISRKYYSWSFFRDRKQADKMNQALDKERSGKKKLTDKSENSRPTLSDMSTKLEIDDGVFSVEKTPVHMTLYYDLQYNDIVYKYDGDRYDIGSMSDFEVGSRNIEYLKETIRERVERLMMINHQNRSGRELLPKSKLRRLVGEEQFKLMMQQKATDHNSTHIKMSKSFDMETVIEEEDSVENPVEVVQRREAVLRDCVHNMRNFAIVENQKKLLRLMSESSKAQKKLIVRSFYIGENESYTVSIVFDSLTYTFEIQAFSWESNRVIKARLGLDTFFKMFKFTRMMVDKKSHKTILKERLGDNLNIVLESLSVIPDTKRDLGRLELKWGEDGESSTNDDASDSSVKEGHEPRDPSSRKSLLMPMASVENRQQDAEKLYNRMKGIYNKKMTDQDRSKLFMEKILVLQKTWRMLMVRKLYNMRLAGSKKPEVKVGITFKRAAQLSKIVLNYHRFETRLRVSISVMDVVNNESKQLETRIGLKPIMQHVYGMEDWSLIEPKGKYFFNHELPVLSRAMRAAIEVGQQADAPSKYWCLLNFSTPQMLNLTESDNRYLWRKQNEGDKKEYISDAELTRIIVMLQRRFRDALDRRRGLDLIKLVQLKRKKYATQGELKQLTFKKIDNKYYRVWIYERSDDQDTNLNFAINPIQENGTHQTMSDFVSYKINEHKLMNSHGMQLVDYLTGQLRRQQREAGPKFFLDLPDKPDHVKVGGKEHAKVVQVDEESEEEYEPSEVENDRNTLDTVKQSVLRDVAVDDKILIVKSKVDSRSFEFNLYYDKYGTPYREHNSNMNYYRIMIDVNKIKKSTPNMATVHNKDELKDIVNDISKCFIINEQDELLVDQNKIDPTAVVVKNRHLMKFTDDERKMMHDNKKKLDKLNSIIQRNPASMSVLSKTAKIFSKTHYLMIIYKQDHIVGEDAMNALTNYEMYSINYVVELKNLSNAGGNRITLTFSEQDCKELFDCKNDMEINRYFTKKLSMYDDGKAILPVVKKMNQAEILEYERKGIVFYYAKGLQLIQRYMQNRKFLIAYQQYKAELKRLEDNTILRQAINIENNWYHAVVYLSNSDTNFKVKLWNARTYKEFRLKVSKEFSKTYMGSSIRDTFAEVLLKSLFFVNDQNDVMMLRYNYKAIPEKITRALAGKHDGKHKRH